ncbi:MAG: aminoacyl-histidine dipeptidase [Agathobacter sp.]|nr:aminoacyl-histidine dipeptidase [Agathobacter sp.]
MRVLENLKPKKVFNYFEDIASIPHGSRNTKQISDYLVDFAKKHNFEYYQDKLNNVIIIKEATEGYENAEPIIIQGHMDMVCEKENGCSIDFEKDGLSLIVDGDFIKAKDTTLGADDGIAVAYALAILDSDDIEHPRLEVVITVDEEIGMLGAIDIDLSMLKGKKLLNIDSELEGEFLTSCAGGLSLHSSIPVKRVNQKGIELDINISGLDGGHSGAEIHKEHGNANIIMGRVLGELLEHIPFGIKNLAGGQKDNAIPRECNAQILIPLEGKSLVEQIIVKLEKTLKNEFMVSDKNICISIENYGVCEANVLDYSSVNKVLFFLRTTPNGVVNMSQVINGLVETSLNLGIMELEEHELNIVTSIRSSVTSRKFDLTKRVTSIIEILGGEVKIEGDYPAWEYKPESELRTQIEKVYIEQFGTAPVFNAIHAGLECGLFSEKIPELDCVSFGPTMFDIHTPKERLSISSTERYWRFLLKLLKESK